MSDPKPLIRDAGLREKLETIRERYGAVRGVIDELYESVRSLILIEDARRSSSSDVPGQSITNVVQFVEATYKQIKETTPLDEFLAEIERRFIEEALNDARGNKSEAAVFLGLKRSTFADRISRLGLEGRVSEHNHDVRNEATPLPIPLPPESKDELVGLVTRNYHAQLGNPVPIGAHQVSAADQYTYLNAAKILNTTNSHLASLVHERRLHRLGYQGHNALVTGYEIIRYNRLPSPLENYSPAEVAELFHTDEHAIQRLIFTRLLDMPSGDTKDTKEISGISVGTLFDLVHPMEGSPRYAEVMKILGYEKQPDDESAGVIAPKPDLSIMPTISAATIKEHESEVGAVILQVDESAPLPAGLTERLEHHVSELGNGGSVGDPVMAARAVLPPLEETVAAVVPIPPPPIISAPTAQKPEQPPKSDLQIPRKPVELLDFLINTYHGSRAREIGTGTYKIKESENYNVKQASLALGVKQAYLLSISRAPHNLVNIVNDTISGYEIIRFHFMPDSRGEPRQYGVAAGIFHTTIEVVERLVGARLLLSVGKGLTAPSSIVTLFNKVHPKEKTPEYDHVMKLLEIIPELLIEQELIQGRGDENDTYAPDLSASRADRIKQTGRSTTSSERSTSLLYSQPVSQIPLKPIGNVDYSVPLKDLPSDVPFHLYSSAGPAHWDSAQLRNMKIGGEVMIHRDDIRRLNLVRSFVTEEEFQRQYEESTGARYKERDVADALRIVGIGTYRLDNRIRFAPGTIDVVTLSDADLKKIGELVKPIVERQGVFVPLATIRAFIGEQSVPDFMEKVSQGRVTQLNPGGETLYNVVQSAIHYKRN